MRQLILHIAFLASVLNGIRCYGQVSSYVFRSSPISPNTYPDGTQPLTNSNPHTLISNIGNLDATLFNGDTTGSNSSDLTGTGFPVGFNFRYAGHVFNRFAISTNGYIKLGSDTGLFTIHNETLLGGVFEQGNDASRANVISALQKQIGGNSANHYLISSIYYWNAGLPGRMWLGVNFNFINAGQTDGAQCTLLLQENTNDIHLLYTRIGATTAHVYKIALGLRGGLLNNTQPNIQVRQVISGINTWDNSVFGFTDTAACDLNAMTLPYNIGNGGNALHYSFHDTIPPPILIPTCPITFLLSGDQDYSTLDSSTGIFRNSVIGWSAAPLADSSYYFDVYLSTDNPPTEPVLSHTRASQYAPPILVANTTYYYNIVATNSIGSSGTCVGHFKTGASIRECIGDSVPNMASSNYYYSGTCPIKKFYFNDLHYDYSPANTLITSFEDISPFVAHVHRGQAYKMYLSLNNQTPSGGCNYPGGLTFRAYIDYNQNGEYFDALNEQAFQSIANPVDSFTVTIPMEAELGRTKMNFGIFDPQNGPCGSGLQFYYIYILPAMGCDSFRVNETHEDVKCYGDSSALIKIAANGGTAPYGYGWNDSLSSDSLRQVGRGSYQASVTDAHGCVVSTALFVVRQPSALMVSVPIVVGTSNGNSNGSILVMSPTGGTPPYTYSWSDSSTNDSSRSGLQSGTYSLTVSDSNGCEDTLLIVIAVSVGLPVLNESVVSVYPNPARDHLIIESENIDRIVAVTIRNTLGEKLVQLGQYLDAIDVSKFASGMYFIEITTFKGMIMKRWEKI